MGKPIITAEHIDYTAEGLRYLAAEQCWNEDQIPGICSLAADLLERNAALESDAVAQAGEIERLKALADGLKFQLDGERENVQHFRSLAATRQPLREMPFEVKLMLDGVLNYHAECPHCRTNAYDVERYYSPRGGEGESGGHKERP